MAKLNGVKTVKDNSVIEYNGVKYVQVRDFSRATINVGDIVQPLEYSPDVTVGGFYEVVFDSFLEVSTIMDDEEVDHSNVLHRDLHLYRAASKADNPTRTTGTDYTTESVIGRSEDEYRVGDIIEIMEETGGYDVGEFAVITRIDHRGIWYENRRGKGIRKKEWHTFEDFIRLVAPVESTLI